MKSTIDIFYDDIEILDLDPEFFVSWLSTVCIKEGFKLAHLNIVFTSDEGLRKINKEHLSHDYYTDIITFDYSEGSQVEGELFISVDRVTDNAGSYNQDVKKERLRVIVHGVLHLCGYKDKTEDDQKSMRAKEDFYLKMVSRETF